MNTTVIHAASYLGPEGFGNDLTGFCPWPEALAENLKKGELDGLHWSLLSNSDPSRFLRMDLMCRLGFMAAELLAINFDALPDARRDRVGVCVSSFTGCLDTDIRFVRMPRPSSFAYTLPSTVIGELCIRYRLKGPVLSLITAAPGGAASLTEALEWVKAGDADLALCLSLEAMNPSTVGTLALPPELVPQSWHGAALLLGPAENGAREKPVEVGSLQALCQKLCRLASHE